MNEDEIITLYKSGVCIDDLIEKYNCLEIDIRHILKENNVDRHVNQFTLRGDDYIHFDSVDVYDYNTKELITTANTVREFCEQHDIDSREVYEMIRHNKRRYQSCIIDDTPRRVYYTLKEKPVKLMA